MGKLELAGGWRKSLEREIFHNQVQWLPLTLDHCAGIESLPWHHRDPFDRMLVSQAAAEGLVLITCDQHIPQYGVNVIW